MSEFITIGEAASLFCRPVHQARRTADRLWPDLPRVARARVIPKERLCELAAAIELRYGKVKQVTH